MGMGWIRNFIGFKKFSVGGTYGDMMTLDRTGCQVLQFTLVYVDGQGHGARQQDRNKTGTKLVLYSVLSLKKV